jgi:hypothetical protein
MIKSHLRKVIATTALASMLAGCGWFGVSDLNWTEDVKLPDGRVIAVTRHQEFKGPSHGCPPTESDQWLEFKNPNTGERIRWSSDRSLRVIALLMNGRTPMLLMEPGWGGDAQRYGCPDPIYLLYRYDNVWHQAKLSDIPVATLRVNRTVGPGDSRTDIEKSEMHLPVQKTQQSTFNNRPFVIRFDWVKEQTFGGERCQRGIYDWLIEGEEH